MCWFRDRVERGVMFTDGGFLAELQYHHFVSYAYKCVSRAAAYEQGLGAERSRRPHTLGGFGVTTIIAVLLEGMDKPNTSLQYTRKGSPIVAISAFGRWGKY